MLKYIKAIVFKEYAVYKKNWMFNLFNILGISIFLSVFFILRFKVSKNINPAPLGLYILMIIGYSSFMQNLKFWQEKANKSLESVLATNIPIKIFLTGKIMFPLIISIISIFFNYIIMNIGAYLLIGKILLDLKILIHAIWMSSVFNCCYGVINGYCMWCGSMAQAKFMQVISLFIYGCGILNAFIYKSSSLNFKSINITLVIFVIISSIFLIRIKKEKAILNLLD